MTADQFPPHNPLQSLNGNHTLIHSAKLHLTLAIAYAKAYEEVKSSIYWLDSNEKTKRIVREKLNHLAFDAYTSLLEAGSNLNQYIDEARVSKVQIPVKKWMDMIQDLNLSAAWMEREHSHEINRKQLTIF